MKIKRYNETNYKKIMQEVGEGSYEMFTSENPFTNLLYSTLPEKTDNRFLGVCLSTSATIATATVDYLVEGIKICKSEHVVIQRTFRYCEHDSQPHINADDSAIFVDEKGDVWKISRNDSQDHYIGIAEWAGLGTIAEAYHLPKEPRGPYYKYIENGASVPIKLEVRTMK